jgi:hypothetical protein
VYQQARGFIVTFLPGNLYHTGLIVADIDEAIAQFEPLGFMRWTTRILADVSKRDAEGVETYMPFWWNYSAEGPHHIELIQPIPPAVMEFGLHHFGYWSADFSSDIAQMSEAGYSFEYDLVTPEGDTSDVTYFARPNSSRIELVAESVRPMLAELWDSVPPA